MIFPLLKTWLAPFISSTLGSSSNNKAYKTPGGGFVTIGGGGGASSRNRQGTCNITANVSFGNESEEHIVKGKSDVKMQPIHGDSKQHSLNAIVVSKKVSITTEDFDSKGSAETFQPV
jgi:hypothetical protein